MGKVEDDYEEILNSIVHDEASRQDQTTKMLSQNRRSSGQLLEGLSDGRGAQKVANAATKGYDEPKIDFASKNKAKALDKKNLNEDSDWDLDNY